MIAPQIKYLDIQSELFKVSKLLKEEDIYLDTINNRNADIKIEAEPIEKYNSNKEKFFKDIKLSNGTLYTTNKLLTEEVKKYDKKYRNR